MTILTKSLLIGVAAAGLVLLWDTLSSVKKQKLHSVRIVVEATPRPSSNFTEEEVMKLTEKALDERMKVTGHSYRIKKLQGRSMEITVEDINSTDFARQLIGGNTKVEFWDVCNIVTLFPFFMHADTIGSKYLNPEVKKASEPGPEDSAASASPLKRFRSEDNPETQGAGKGLGSLIQFLSEPYNGNNNKTPFPAALGYVNIKDTALVNKIFSEAGRLLPNAAKFYYGPVDNSQKDILGLYAINTKGRLTAPVGNEDIAHADCVFESTSGNHVLSLKFTPSGSRKWADMTSENVDRPIAILVNDIVISAPTVISPIEGGAAEINGAFSIDECRTMALQLSSPGVPADLKAVSEEIVEGNAIFQLRTLLLALAGLIVGTGAAYLIFKMLKTS